MEINLDENYEVQPLSKYRCIELPQNLKKGYYGGTMSFFESEIVCDELEELHDLQNEIYGNLFDYPKMTKKRAVFGYEEELYVKFKIKVQAWNGPSFGAMGVQYSNIHPTVKVKIKAFDMEKKKVLRAVYVCVLSSL